MTSGCSYCILDCKTCSNGTSCDSCFSIDLNPETKCNNCY